MIKGNIRKLSKQEKEILLEKIRLNEITDKDLKIIIECIDYNLNYECILLLLELEDYILKIQILCDLKHELKLEEVKNILNKISCKDIKGAFDLYMFHKGKYILEKALSQ